MKEEKMPETNAVKVKSPIFGEVLKLGGLAARTLEASVQVYPIDSFGALNKHLNTLGYCLKIERLPGGDSR